jgi:hypothetical protein
MMMETILYIRIKILKIEWMTEIERKFDWTLFMIGTNNKRKIRINTNAGKDGFLFVGHATD